MSSSSVRLSGRVVVVSPHLDDAALSLGAGLHRASRSGADVTLVTVFGGDVDSPQPAGDWDRAGGFKTAGEAVRARRQEDRRACKILGVEQLVLPFLDDQYERGADEGVIADALAGAVEGADIVLTPSFPLAHDDHVLVNRLVTSLHRPERRLGLYVEQPYALARRAKPPEDAAPWLPLETSPASRIAKVRACRAYGSQVPLFMLSFVSLRLASVPELVSWVEA